MLLRAIKHPDDTSNSRLLTQSLPLELREAGTLPSISKRITVLHVISDLSIGGAEMTLYKLLSRVDKERFSHVVVTLKDGGNLRKRIEELGVPVYSVAMRLPFPTLTSVQRWVNLARRVKPDVIQGWMVHGNLAALFAVNFMRGHVPVLWNIRQSLYSFNYEKPVTALAIKLGARLSHKPALILYNSRTSAAQHNTLGYQIDKTLVIPNGFDTDKFSPSDVARRSLRSELGVTENTLLIALIARYHPMKDHSNFLYAASLLLKKYPDVRFVLSGEQINWGNRALRESIQQLGLVKQVHLLDVRQDMPRIMAAVDIAALSSYDEGFPNVIGEAMSCGVPCVATHLSDLPAVIGKTGRLVPPRDSQALSSALESLIEIGPTGRQRLGRDARARIVEHFRLDPVVAQYEALYEKVTARQKEFRETSTAERRHVYWQQDEVEGKRL